MTFPAARERVFASPSRIGRVREVDRGVVVEEVFALSSRVPLSASGGQTEEGEESRVSEKDSGDTPKTVARVLLEHMGLRGLKVFLGNAGTDFCSLIEAFVAGEKEGAEMPVPLAAAHESVLMSVAQGYFFATGRPAVAMVHVGVGTANALASLMAASRSRIPVLLLAGRTPVTQEGSPASRSAVIHWHQEMFDQAAMVREWVKWEYELRRPDEVFAVFDRALAMARAEPAGPVYLTLPRELLSEPYRGGSPPASLRQDLPEYPPDPAQVRRAADWIAGARRPLVVTSAAGRTAAGARRLASFAEAAGAAVISVMPEFMNLPCSHPCHQGFQVAESLSGADLVLVVECPVPWIPRQVRPREDAKVIQIGMDPLCGRLPVRFFPSDLTLQADPGRAMKAIREAILRHPERREDAVARRLETLRRRNRELREGWAGRARDRSRRVPLSPTWVSSVVGRILGDEAVVFNEYDNALLPFAPGEVGRYFGVSQAGFLGWGLGAALGYKLGHPEALVVATVGDGSYLFGVPSAAHQFSTANRLPFLTVIYNNQGWAAVRRATRDVHPDGLAAAGDRFPLTRLSGLEGLHGIAQAFGGHGERVRRPEELEPALLRARKAVLEEKRQAVVNVMVGEDG